MALKFILVVSLTWFSFGNGCGVPAPAWDSLKVSFGRFTSLPRKEADAVADGWIKISECDADCKYRGIRYVKDNDYSVTLLFDINGFIAGIQAGIAKAGLPAIYPPAKQIGQMYQVDTHHYTLTAYFVDPATICSTGRTESDFTLEGTGTNLYIQNGSDPETQSILIPTQESGMQSTAFTLGPCFRMMGVHYWYDQTTDMSCQDIQSIFLLYNDKKLTGFGWTAAHNLTSPRWEHPTHPHLSAFMNPVPKCLYDIPVLSTMHVYLTSSPQTISCTAP